MPQASPIPTPTPKIIPPQVIWDLQSGSLPPNEEKNIKDAVASKISSFTFSSTNEDMLITSANVSGIYGVLSAEEKSRNLAPNPTATNIFLLVKSKSVWNVISQQDTNFCPVLNSLPDNIISKSSKDFWKGFHENSTGK